MMVDKQVFLLLYTSMFRYSNAIQTSSTTPLRPSSPSPRLILLDRDGVINHDVGAPGVLHSSQLKLTNDAANAIANFRNHGCKVVIITNQSCVGKSLITNNDLISIHDTLQTMLLEDNANAVIDQIFTCTSLRDSGDYRMKPNPGMIYEACDYFGFQPEECVMIGDALRDLEAASAAGVPTKILVETGYGLGIMNGQTALSGDCGNEADNGNTIVRLVDDQYCQKFGYPLGMTMDTILPFYYTKDLSMATSWILQEQQHHLQHHVKII